jgi:hypothetical protein
VALRSPPARSRASPTTDDNNNNNDNRPISGQ